MAMPFQLRAAGPGPMKSGRSPRPKGAMKRPRKLGRAPPKPSKLAIV